jgi:hypothetical protein
MWDRTGFGYVGFDTEMTRGLLGDRLGAHIYKKRIKLEGRGKSGGARAIVLFRDKDVTFFAGVNR